MSVLKLEHMWGRREEKGKTYFYNNYYYVHTDYYGLIQPKKRYCILYLTWLFM